MKTLIGIPTYNEIDNLPRLVADVLALCPDADVLVVDDGSPDGTGDWADHAGQTDPRIRCLHRAGKGGSGSAILAALRDAVANHYDYALIMDADFSHHPRYVPPLIAGMAAADVTIGSVYAPGAGTENWPLWRFLLSRAANAYTRLCLELTAADCSNAFRCYRVSMLSPTVLNAVMSRGFSFQEEMLWRLAQQGARILEIPTVFTDRIAGRSKLSLHETWRSFWVITRLGLQHRCGWRWGRAGGGVRCEDPHKPRDL